MADAVFEMTRRRHVVALVAAPVLTVAGAVLLLTGTGSTVFGLTLVVLGPWATIQVVLWAPYRVTLGDTAVVLYARARQVRIPWVHLESVAPSCWDHRRQALIWRRKYGPPIRTTSAFTDVHRMLTEIERRAPHARVTL